MSAATHRFTETTAPIGNGLYSAHEWDVAYRNAAHDGYRGEIDAMLERDAAFVPGVGVEPYAETDTSAWDALFGGTEPWDAAPDLSAYARSTAGLS